MPAPKFRTPCRAAAAAIAVAASLPLVAGCGGSKANTAPARSGPVAATVGELQNLASSLRHPIYWAGAKKGYTYELTRTRDGNVFIRYLPPGVQVGDKRPAFLTVGTYPQPDAYKNVRTALKRRGARQVRVPGGGIAVQNVTRSTSVYIAYPNSSLLMEVFSPSAKTARALVRAGTVRQLG